MWLRGLGYKNFAFLLQRLRETMYSSKDKAFQKFLRQVGSIPKFEKKEV